MAALNWVSFPASTVWIGTESETKSLDSPSMSDPTLMYHQNSVLALTPFLSGTLELGLMAGCSWVSAVAPKRYSYCYGATRQPHLAYPCTALTCKCHDRGAVLIAEFRRISALLPVQVEGRSSGIPYVGYSPETPISLN